MVTYFCLLNRIVYPKNCLDPCNGGTVITCKILNLDCYVGSANGDCHVLVERFDTFFRAYFDEQFAFMLCSAQLAV